MDTHRKTIFSLIVILAFLALVPSGCSGLSNGNSGTNVDGKDITLNISFPKEDGVIYGDTIGFPIYIYADIDSPNGIKEVWITNGINQSLCRADIGHRFFCQNPWHEGKNTIKITATDNLGNSISKIRNYSLVIGQQPPPTMSTSPQNTLLSGFGFPLGICSILISLLIITIRKR